MVSCPGVIPQLVGSRGLGLQWLGQLVPECARSLWAPEAWVSTLPVRRRSRRANLLMRKKNRGVPCSAGVRGPTPCAADRLGPVGPWPGWLGELASEGVGSGSLVPAPAHLRPCSSPTPALLHPNSGPTPTQLRPCSIPTPPCSNPTPVLRHGAGLRRPLVRVWDPGLGLGSGVVHRRTRRGRPGHRLLTHLNLTVPFRGPRVRLIVGWCGPSRWLLPASGWLHFGPSPASTRLPAGCAARGPADIGATGRRQDPGS